MEFLTTNAPDPPHWTLISCFGAFHTIWVHLGLFGCLKKLGAKRAELVQNFVPQSRIGIFRNECIRSIPLDPKLIFWCLSYNFGALEIVWLTYNIRCKTGRTVQKFMPRSRFGIFRNERNRSTHWTLNSCFGVFRTNLVLSGPFGCLQNSVQNGPNWCKSSCHEVALEFFLQRTHPIHPIGP